MTSWWITHARAEHAPRARPLPDRCDIAVVGAGVVGLTVARELLMTGADVQVVEAAAFVGSGVSGQSTAKVTVGTGLRLDEISATSGEDAAREYAQAGSHGLAMVRELLERQRWVRASPATHLLYATTPPGVGRIEDHVDLARRCGLDVRRCEAPFPWASATMAYDDQLVVQPVDVVQALAAEVAALDGRIALSTAVTDVRPDEFGVEVVTSRGVLRADRAIVATGWEVEHEYHAVGRPGGGGPPRRRRRAAARRPESGAVPCTTAGALRPGVRPRAGGRRLEIRGRA
jgi:glycine/D-amino acid oxidase-like deaminating enzyme